MIAGTGKKLHWECIKHAADVKGQSNRSASQLRLDRLQLPEKLGSDTCMKKYIAAYLGNFSAKRNKSKPRSDLTARATVDRVVLRYGITARLLKHNTILVEPD